MTSLLVQHHISHTYQVVIEGPYDDLIEDYPKVGVTLSARTDETHYHDHGLAQEVHYDNLQPLLFHHQAEH